MVGNRKWAGFLFNWSSHYQIYVVQYFLTNTVVWKKGRDRCPGKRNVHFQFPSVAQNDLCLSSLLTSFTWELAGSRVDTLVRALAYHKCGLWSILTTTPYMAWVCWFSAPRGFFHGILAFFNWKLGNGSKKEVPDPSKGPDQQQIFKCI